MCETNTKSVFCFLQVGLGERRGEMQRHSEERPCEDTGKRQPFLSQGERLQKNPAETTNLGLWPPELWENGISII